MNLYRFALSLTTCLFITFKVFAGLDPVGWSLSPASGLPAQTTVGNSYTVFYTFTNNLPHPVALTVKPYLVSGQFSLSNGCNPAMPLAAKGKPNSTCTVGVQYLPNRAAIGAIRLEMSYHNNVVPLPELRTTTTGQSTTTSIQGYVSQALPAITYTGSTYPVSFTYVNRGSVAITPTAVNISGFTPTSNTCNSPIPGSGGSCMITGSFSPTVVGGPVVFSVNYIYQDGSTSRSVPLSTSTVVQNGANCHQIVGMATLPLPSETYLFSDNVVRFTFTNYCAQETLSNITVSQLGGNATLTPGTNTCTGTLPQGHSCSYFVSVVPTQTSANLGITATLTYGGGLTASATTAEQVNAIPNQALTHTVTFVNQCNFPVWYEFENGNGSPTSPDPTPAGGSYQLNAQVPGQPPSFIDLSVNEYVNGAVYVRTGCNTATGVCATGGCQPISAGDPMRCAVGTQPSNFPPSTKFEFTMSAAANADGVYDVSMVNGFNVPGQVRSRAPVDPSNSFGCGQSPGAFIQPAATGLGACPWTFSPPSTGGNDIPANYTAVTGGSTTDCVPGPACTGGTSCGMGFASGKFDRQCGAFLGYTNILTYTGFSASTQWDNVNLYNAFNLGGGLSSGYGSVSGQPATFTDMWGCTPTSTGALKSGYAFTYLVCGCYNWNQSGSLAPTAQTSQCLADNPDWEAAVFPRIFWFKQACPTAYSYNHDDQSSSFACNVPAQKTSYQITFCPGGATGQPG